MVCKNVVLIILVTSIGISRIQALEDGDNAQTNQKQTPENRKSGIVFDALTIQIGNSFNTGPNSTNIYGAILRQTNQVYSSDNDREPSKVETQTIIASGGPEQGVSNASLGGSQNQLPVGGTRNVVRSITIQSGNTYNTDPNSTNIYGSIVQQTNQVYSSDNDREPSKVETQTIIASGGPEQGVSYASLGGSQNQLPVGGTRNVVRSITIQSGNTYNTDPNSTNIYGSIVQQTNQVYSSNNDREPSKVETQTIIASGGPEQGVSYASLGEGQNQLPVGGTRNVQGSVTIQKGNTYNIDPNSKNLIFGSVTNRTNPVLHQSSSSNVNLQLGSVTIQEGNTYNTHSKSSGSRPAKTSFNSLALSDKNGSPNKQPNLAFNKSFVLLYFIVYVLSNVLE